MSAQQILRSAWASTQSDQSFRCPHEEALGPYLPQKHTAETLIRLGGCPGWSESLLCTQLILLVLSCCGSFDKADCLTNISDLSGLVSSFARVSTLEAGGSVWLWNTSENGTLLKSYFENQWTREVIKNFKLLTWQYIFQKCRKTQANNKPKTWLDF